MKSVDLINEELKKMAVLASGKDDVEKLEKFLLHLARNEPSNLTPLYCLGSLYFRLNNYAQSEKWFTELLLRAENRFPELADAHMCLSFINWKKGDHGKIIHHAENYLDYDPSEPRTYTMLCYAYHVFGDREKVKYYLMEGQRLSRCGFHFQPAADFEIPKNVKEAIEAIWNGDKVSGALNKTYEQPGAFTWVPEFTADGVPLLRGATVNGGGEETAVFEIYQSDGEETPLETVPAVRETLKGGIVFWSATVSGLEPGRVYRYRLLAGHGKAALKGEEREFETRKFALPKARTKEAEVTGDLGLYFNGEAGGTNLPTNCFFTYGYEEGKHDFTTPPKAVPPARTGRTRDILTHAPSRFLTYAMDVDFTEVGSQNVSGHSCTADFALKLTAPFGRDRNHLNGIGPADLLLGWKSLTESRDGIEGEYPGKRTDFRDAEIELKFRSPGLDAKDFYFVCNAQSEMKPEDRKDFDATSPWSLTGQLVDMAEWVDGGWHTLKFKLSDDTNDWSFCGNNPVEQPENVEVYCYAPLGEVLSAHRENIFFWFLFGDEKDTPEGAIDLYSISLRYRNKSLLAAGAKTRLLGWPSGSIADPLLLTGGWLGNPERFWFSGPNPSSPQEFTWQIGCEVVIQGIRIHQNFLKPAKEVQVWVSDDGGDYRKIWGTILPKTEREDDPNSRAFHRIEGGVKAGYFKLAIVSGHQSDYWGLDAVEVFGEGLDAEPEPAPCSISEEVGGLKPGSRVYYRFVAENALGRIEGEERSVRIPEDRRPVIHSAEVLKAAPDKVTILVRMSAMGHETELSGRFEAEGGEVLEGPTLATGGLSAPRHITYVVKMPEVGKGCRGTLVAANENGQGAPYEISW